MVAIVDDGYNFVVSHWMCWECVTPRQIMNVQAGTAPECCGKPMEYLDGLFIAPPDKNPAP